MALNSASITAAVISAAPFPGGPGFPILANAIGLAVYTWAVIPANVRLQGVTTGLAGAGAVLGSVIIPPNPALASAIIASSGLVGPTAPLLATALGVGIPTAFLSAQYSGGSVGVSAGSDLSKITFANTATLIPLLTAFLAGSSSPIVANAIASVVSGILLTGTGVGVVAPVAPAPGPGAGISTSFIF